MNSLPHEHPPIVLLGAPHAMARAMAHTLQQAWQDFALLQKRAVDSWQCLAPEPGETSQPWPTEAVVYVLGLDWRDTSSANQIEASTGDAALPETPAQQITAWRLWLEQQHSAYTMLYGKPDAQWVQLAASLKSIAPSVDWNWISASNPWKPSARMRRNGCEQCDDPDCERRLFEALRQN